MSLARFAKRRDANESQIAEALERAGFEVYVIDRPADLLAWRPDKGWFVIEVKLPHGKLTAAQKALRDSGQGKGIIIARTALEALRALRATGD